MRAKVIRERIDEIVLSALRWRQLNPAPQRQASSSA